MPSAPIQQCTILAGGLGTRLGSLTEASPKPMLIRGGRPFLVWLMRELCRFGVTEFLLLTGHLSEEIERAIPALQAMLPRRVSITVSREPGRAGTGGAVYHAGAKLHERFLLCNGDSLFAANLAELLAAAADDGPEVVGRMMLRQLPDASRYGVVTLEADRVTGFHDRPRHDAAADAADTINAGVYLFHRRILESLRPVCSLETDVLPALAGIGALRGTVSEGYFRDIGVPDDFERADDELRALRGRPALFLDRDGVINLDHGHVGSRDRFEWVPDALDTIRRAAANAGWHVFIVTNQSGVARGLVRRCGGHRSVELDRRRGTSPRRHDRRHAVLSVPSGRHGSGIPRDQRLAQTGVRHVARPDPGLGTRSGALRIHRRSNDRSRGRRGWHRGPSFPG